MCVYPCFWEKNLGRGKLLFLLSRGRKETKDKIQSLLVYYTVPIQVCKV